MQIHFICSGDGHLFFSLELLRCPSFVAFLKDGSTLGENCSVPHPPQSLDKLEREETLVRKNIIEFDGLEFCCDYSLDEGEQIFVISAEWFSQWETGLQDAIDFEDYNGISKFLPGPIDNSSICDDGELVLELSMDDYVLLRKPAWKRLRKSYGGGPAIVRTYVHQAASLDEFLLPADFQSEESRNPFCKAKFMGHGVLHEGMFIQS